MTKILDFLTKRHARAEQEREALERLLAPLHRYAWYPRVEARAAYRSASKFSGIPVLAAGETWPRCRHCEQPMQLFLQLNSAHLPDEAQKPFGDGFLQVFYCTNEASACESECEAFFPFSRSTLVRVVNFAHTHSHDIIANPVAAPFAEKVIVGWEKKTDYPNAEELALLGSPLTDKQLVGLSESPYPLAKDKLLGWPFWGQGVEYPICPDCGEPMKLIFQLGSEDNLPYLFGDAGCAHITQCERHKSRMAIAWACS